jgi:hypothetical protein
MLSTNTWSKLPVASEIRPATGGPITAPRL